MVCLTMQINQRKDGSIELKLTDDEIDIMKKNNNIFHIDAQKTKDCLDIIMTYCWRIFDGLPEKDKKRLQSEHPPTNYNPET